MASLSSFIVAALAAVAFGLSPPQKATKRQIVSASQLRPHYDFIIIGGGTSGLTVADRLTEAFPSQTVLIVEYGTVEYAPGGFDPPQIGFTNSSTVPRPAIWTFNSVANLEVQNKQALVLAGRTVGGSSAVNGMFFDRPSRHDFDAWARAGSPEFDKSPHKWDNDGLFPYFRKAVTFTPPPATVAAKHGYTWDLSAYGGTTPIHSSYPPFLWGDHQVARNAWLDMRVPVNKECASGDKTGLCWIPISQHPLTARRSHAGLGHYADVTGNSTKPRLNYDLLTNHQVVRVVYPNGLASGPPLVEIKPVGSSGGRFNATAKAEVIVSAGAFNTPTVLHRSGIGPASVLKEYGIPLVLDLPGVGNNLQDHSGPSISWNYTKPTNFYPMPSDMLNATFAAQATAEFDQVPAQGPYTLSMSNSAIFIPLHNLTTTHSDIITKLRTMVASGSAPSFLPLSYASDPTLSAGYNQQLLEIASLLENPSAPSLEATFATGTSMNALNLHTLSRGTVRLDSADHLAQPILDYRTASNPIDFDIFAAHVLYLRRMISTPALQKYGAVELGPGDAVAGNRTALMEYVKEKMTLSYMHPCCTAAMLPLGKGGVVGPDLRVHGAAGLRVVDVSVLPFLPSSHLSQLAYAVGEKAADIIVGEWRGRFE